MTYRSGFVLALVALMSVHCLEHPTYHAQSTSSEEDVLDSESRPDLDGEADENTPAPTPRREATETALESPCDVAAPLTQADLDPGNLTPFTVATLKEAHKDGAVTSRKLRRFGYDGATIWQHEEFYTGEGCLGVATTRAWDEDGNLVLDRAVVLDADIGADLSPYMPLTTLEWRATYGTEGRPLTEDTDLGADGIVEHRVSSTYDERDLLVRVEARQLVDITQEDRRSTFRNLNESTRDWSHDARGNVTTEIQRSESDHRIKRTTWDEHDQILTQTIHRDEVRLVSVVNTWAGREAPLTSVVTNLQSPSHDTRWSYRDGALFRIERYEDLNNDGHFDGLEREEYDRVGRLVVRQRDQPLDDNVDLHQTFRFDAMGRPIENRSIDPQTGQILGIQSWTYDEEGRELTQAYHGRDGVPLRLYVQEYDPLGRLIWTRRYDGDHLRAVEKMTYEDDKMVRIDHDLDGDGLFDAVGLQAWDRAGNPIWRGADWDNDGIFEVQTFALY